MEPIPASLADEQVIAHVLAGDTAFFEILMRRYNQRLFRITRAILMDDNEAEDVIQDAYVRAYASLHQFAGLAKFSTWLTKIAIHEASRRLRRKRVERIPLVPERADQKSPGPDPEHLILRDEAASFLEKAIDALPPRYRSVFVLREVEGMSTTETADCLNLTEETVKVRLFRAREALRKELGARAGITTSQAFTFRGIGCDRVVRGVFEQLGACVSNRTALLLHS